MSVAPTPRSGDTRARLEIFCGGRFPPCPPSAGATKAGLGPCAKGYALSASHKIKGYSPPFVPVHAIRSTEKYVGLGNLP
jgi:hypothetical protein